MSSIIRSLPFRHLVASITGMVLLVPFLVRARDVDVPEPFPVGFSFFDPVQFPEADSDVNGFRLSLFYGRNNNVMGLDIGGFVSMTDGDLFGLEISGLVNNVGSSGGSLQIAGVANNCYDNFYGVQIAGIANKVGGVVEGGQIGCFNLSGDMDGFQIGVFNKAARAVGLQIGVVNYAKSMSGVQIGLFNIIETCKDHPFLPIVNANF